jgi:hypothetical protein
VKRDDGHVGVSLRLGQLDGRQSPTDVFKHTTPMKVKIIVNRGGITRAYGTISTYSPEQTDQRKVNTPPIE